MALDAYCAALYSPGATPQVLFTGTREACLRYVELRLVKHSKGLMGGFVRRLGQYEWRLEEKQESLVELPSYGLLRIVAALEISRVLGVQVEQVDEGRIWGVQVERKHTPLLLRNQDQDQGPDQQPAALVQGKGKRKRRNQSF